MTAKAVRFSELCHPFPRQREAWEAADSHKYVLYGGARGPGKSYWLRWSLLRLLLRWARQGHRGVRVGLFSLDYPSLKDRQLSKAKAEFPEYLGRWHDQDHEFRLHPQYGGGVVCFRNLDEPSKYKSAEFAAIAVEELTENGVDVFNTLRGSLRWPGIEDTKFLAATNPGGIGHNWVRAYWIDREFPAELRNQAEQFAFVRALPTDNPHLPASYLEELRGLPTKMRRAWLEGDWSVFEGQVFEEWRDDLHVLEEFTPPATWRWGAGLDFGYRKPGWFGLFACGPDGDVVCMDELYFKELYAREAGRQCALQVLNSPGGRGRPEYVAADSAMWAQQGMGSPTVAEEFQLGWNSAFQEAREQGPALWPTAKGEGSRLIRVQLMHRVLASRKDADGTTPPWGQPRLKFHKRCRHAIRTIPALPYDPRKPEDVDTDAEDHAYDGVTYFLMSRSDQTLRPHPQRAGPMLDQDTHPGYDWEHGERKDRKGWKESRVLEVLRAQDEDGPPRGFRNRGPRVRLEE